MPNKKNIRFRFIKYLHAEQIKFNNCNNKNNSFKFFFICLLFDKFGKNIRIFYTPSSYRN